MKDDLVDFGLHFDELVGLGEVDVSPKTAMQRAARSHRECGTCSMCCFAMGVQELDKGFDEWCRYCAPKTSHPCTVYDRRPLSCLVFACGWLQGLMGDDDRPDRMNGILIPKKVSSTDPQPQMDVMMRPHREAHKRLRRYLEVIFEKGVIVKVRAGLKVWRMTGKGRWMEEPPMPAHKKDWVRDARKSDGEPVAVAG